MNTLKLGSYGKCTWLSLFVNKQSTSFELVLLTSLARARQSLTWLYSFAPLAITVTRVEKWWEEKAPGGQMGSGEGSLNIVPMGKGFLDFLEIFFWRSWMRMNAHIYRWSNYSPKERTWSQWTDFRSAGDKVVRKESINLVMRGMKNVKYIQDK